MLPPSLRRPYLIRTLRSCRWATSPIQYQTNPKPIADSSIHQSNLQLMVSIGGGKPFYYKWLETFIAKGGGEEYIPYSHYCHRFTRSIFWEIEDMIPFSNHPLYRFFWGWMGAPEVSLLKLFQGPVIRQASVSAHVVQESICPVRSLSNCIENFDGWFGVYPLLVFPLRVYDRGTRSGFLTPHKRNLHGPGKKWGIWVDVGAYGAPREVKEGRNWDPKVNVRGMEHWTRDEVVGKLAILICSAHIENFVKCLTMSY